MDPFTPRIRYFDFPKKTRMPNNFKTYDESKDPEDYLKKFQAVAKVECWAMPTWCQMFNSTLTGSARVWFDDLPPESVDSYDDFKNAFLANFLQQKKCIKDPVEIHHIKQREGESTEDFVQRFKAESRHVKWRLLTRHGRKHFRHGNNKKLGGNKILPEGETSGISRDQNEDVTSSHSSQNPQGKFWLWKKASLKLRHQ
ncbi:reverse transcriptase domain-containing protein [Tanacetum coccineum]